MINSLISIAKVFLALVVLIINFVPYRETYEPQSEQTFVCGSHDLEEFVESRPSEPTQSRQQRMHVIYKIAVFYDDWFVYKYGHNPTDFIRTLFRQVQIVYDMPSLIPRIRIVVTKVEHVGRDKLPCDFTKDYMECLKSFGQWQNRTYPDRYTDNLYDFAMLLTPKNLYKNSDDSGKKYTIGGSAYPTSACASGHANSGITPIFGLYSAYALAHELGHGLGAHDDSLGKVYYNNKTCVLGVMGYNTEDDYNYFRWGNCSNIGITKHLQSRDGDCLFNEPNSKHIVWDFRAQQNKFNPSQNYDYNKQCEMAYGPHFTRDELNYFAAKQETVTAEHVCQRLVCSRDVLRFTPFYFPFLLEGTECTHNKRNGRCRLGSCVIG